MASRKPEDFYYPQIQYEAMKLMLKNCVENNVDVVICTYSEHIFNAVRVIRHKYYTVNAICYQLDTNGDDSKCEIAKNGKKHK